ncbi:MAG: TIGR02594 family protein [Proteobacteria bacterium]|nr:TIGR02594 family protein [Pseudomonadota bacterium]
MGAAIIKILEFLPWGKLIELIATIFSNDEKVKTAKMKISNEKTKPEERKSWFNIAMKEIGVTEKPGRRNEKRVLEYHASTTLRATSDSVPWCSSFVNWVMIQAGYPGTNNARARSWLEWGVEIDKPIPGCVVVFWRKSIDSKSGHVAFYVRESSNDGYIKVLGGNQSDQVKISTYPKEKVLGYFLPE